MLCYWVKENLKLMRRAGNQRLEPWVQWLAQVQHLQNFEHQQNGKSQEHQSARQQLQECAGHWLILRCIYCRWVKSGALQTWKWFLVVRFVSEVMWSLETWQCLRRELPVAECNELCNLDCRWLILIDDMSFFVMLLRALPGHKLKGCKDIL